MWFAFTLKIHSWKFWFSILSAEDVDKDLVESSASSESEEEISNGSKTNDGTEPPGTNSDSDSEPLEELPIARTRGTRGRP